MELIIGDKHDFVAQMLALIPDCIRVDQSTDNYSHHYPCDMKSLCDIFHRCINAAVASERLSAFDVVLTILHQELSKMEYQHDAHIKRVLQRLHDVSGTGNDH